MEGLMRIREAYAEAGKKQPREYPSLPPWEKLPLEMREAFISVYHTGRKDARKAMEKD
jgi:hypothetical protein